MALAALAAGDLDAWQPLPDAATADDLTAAAPTGEPPIAHRLLLGQPATSVLLPASAGAPFGVVVWLQHDRVTLVETREPALSADPMTTLGAPELTLRSGLAALGDQICWPSIGLTLHRQADGRVLVLYAYPPTTTDVMRASPLAQVSATRTPR